MPESSLCAEHSGQVERIKGVGNQLKLLNGLIVVLITVIATVGGSLYFQIQNVVVSIAGYQTRFAGFEDRLQRLDAADQRMSERIDQIKLQLR